MPKLVQFGAGNIGRSFIGERFGTAGYEVVFIDVDTRLVELMNERRAYRVVTKRNDQPDEIITVSGVRAVDGRDLDAVRAEITSADYIATSVGLAALPKVAPVIAAGIRGRAESGCGPVDIILAENVRDAAKMFGAELAHCLSDDAPEIQTYLSESVGLVETSIGKMVPIMTEADRETDPLWVFAEPYNTLIVDGRAFRSRKPEIDTLKPVDSIEAYVDRKLFIHNLGHAAVAYLGFLAEPTTSYLYEVLENENIASEVRDAMQQSANALNATYTTSLPRNELAAHIDDLLYRFRNRSLKDTVFRVGRDLPRKLGKNDRVIGAALLAAQAGLPFEAIAKVGAAALCFRATDERGEFFASDADFFRRYGKNVERILGEVCDLSRDTADESVVYDSILAQYSAIAG